MHMFCCMAMALRDRIQVLSEDEGTPWQPGVLTSRMYHTIFTGLKQNSVRMELHTQLKAANMEDIPFLELVAQAEANESERLDKVKTKADIASLTERNGSLANKNASGSVSPVPPASRKGKGAANAAASPESDSKFDLLVAKIDSLATNSSSLSDRLLRLEKNMVDGASTRGSANSHTPNPQGPRGPRKVFKCPDCIAANIGYCPHCFKCKETGHKKENCPN